MNNNNFIKSMIFYALFVLLMLNIYNNAKWSNNNKDVYYRIIADKDICLIK